MPKLWTNQLLAYISCCCNLSSFGWLISAECTKISGSFVSFVTVAEEVRGDLKDILGEKVQKIAVVMKITRQSNFTTRNITEMFTENFPLPIYSGKMSNF